MELLLVLNGKMYASVGVRSIGYIRFVRFVGSLWRLLSV
jgi:hypothetical protein